MNVSLSLLKSPTLSCRLAVCALLGTLAACGPTEPARHELTKEEGTVATLPRALTVSPEVPLPTEVYIETQRMPAVAAGNGLYLVVRKEFFGGKPGLRAVRVRAADGAVLDATPIMLDSHPYASDEVLTDPSVAFDGTNFLVIYSWYRLSNLTAYNEIKSVRVRASDGAVLGEASFSFYGTRDSYRPSVAFDGQNYLGVWEGWTVPRNGNPTQFLLNGLRMRPSGERVDDISFAIAPNGYKPQLAYGGGSYLMVWSEGSFTGPLRATRLSPAGASGPMATLTVAGAGGHTPVLASDGSNFLVVWNEAGGVLKAKRVSLSQWRVLDDTAFTVGTGATSSASVLFDAGSFRVTYAGTRGGAPKVISTRVQVTGEVGPEQILVDLHPSTGAERPAVASLGADQNLVAYTEFDPSRNRTFIRARRFSDPQGVPCTPGAPTLTVHGGTELTLECGPGAYADLGAQAADGCGNPVAVHAYNTGADAMGPGPNLGAEGTYSVSYAAWNAQGDVSVTRTVHVEDRTAPVLVLKGAAHQTHTCGSLWVDPGVEATDACYGNLAATVWHTGEVNGWAEGTYTVTYSLTDSGGNTATPVTRTVDVVDCPW
ncbi:DUF5011 domain-containing protein [Stigmatella erecta]|uniref:Pesticidal crystal protein Cry22Aa Ig-like domain-containing protein n=1 Tax=Stigmatella erecta TaxID=83460 RepID=A0A1I0EKS4_9BACT|nr:DUF5011 domain-containing protein [Stigmatella erecta]SET45574.1 protein of unknown function [Stigmatella erecta]